MSPSHAVCRFNFDFSAFADSWNQDVVAAEQDVLAGLQERGLAGDLIYRKTAGHLENYCTESRKDDVNIKRADYHISERSYGVYSSGQTGALRLRSWYAWRGGRGKQT